MTIFRFVKSLSFMSLIITAAALGRDAQVTKMKIKAQDGETVGDLMLTLSLPTSVKEGPEDDYLKIIVPDSKKAVKDHTGNFLEYKLDKRGEIAPQIILLSVIPVRSNFPDKKKIEVLVNVEGSDNKYHSKKETVPEKGSQVLYILHNNFYYALPDLTTYPLKFPYILKLSGINKGNEKLRTSSIEEMPFFDTVSAFGTIWYVFKMYEDDLTKIGTERLQRTWKKRPPTIVYPFMTKKEYRALYPEEKYEDNMGNAFYDFKDGTHLLCFFPLNTKGKKYTSFSFDILAHETGHNVLNILRPDLWKEKITSAGIKAFHESFGDLTALFALLTFDEIYDRVIKVTQADLSKSSFLSVIGEKVINRDASLITDLLVAPSCEEHDLSERFTRAIYNILAETFWSKKFNRNTLSFEKTLFNLSRDLRQLFLKTTLGFSSNNFTFAEFGRNMITACEEMEGFSYFSGYILYGFGKQGIDLHDLSWKICMKTSSSSKNKRECGTRDKGLRVGRSSENYFIDIYKETSYWYTKPFRPQTSAKTLAVIGKDDRKQVTDTTGAAWKVHGQLEMSFGDSKSTGSGTLISPWHVLTAGHNLYDIDTKKEATDILFYPRKSGKYAAAQPSKGVKWKVLPEYKEGNEIYDMGIIELDRSVGAEVGWNGLLVLTDEILKELVINISGYPGDKPEGTMWTDKGKIHKISPLQIHYQLDTNSGQSGSNSWVQLPQEQARSYLPLTGFYNIGVHVLGSQNFNTATRLTTDNIMFIKKFIEEKI